MTNYDYNFKVDLINKINKIKKKEYLINIFKIVYKDNQKYSINNYGIMMYFHNLSDDTYLKLDKYINSIYEKNRNKIEKEYLMSLTDNQ